MTDSLFNGRLTLTTPPPKHRRETVATNTDPVSRADIAHQVLAGTHARRKHVARAA